MPERTLVSPYAPAAGRFRGNLHTHTTVSDSPMEPADVVAAYRAKGYDFLALSDHDYTKEGPRPLHKPPELWDGLTLIRWAMEITNRKVHVLSLGVPALIDRRAHTALQQQVDAVTAMDGAVFFAHPDYPPLGISADELLALDGYHGIEIRNSRSYMPGPSFAEGVPTWDRLLAAGRRVWGLSCDDAHYPEEIGLSWVEVCASACRSADLVRALKAGNFYASSGAQLTLEVEGTTARAGVPDGTRVHWIVDGRPAATGPTFDCREAETYVRCEAEDPEGGRAWSQPLTWQ
jgi:hypothetical protein